MVRTPYSYGAILVRGEDGRYMAHFPDLPEAVTDGADEAEALAQAADCLSEALASRIVDGEQIPKAAEPGQYRISPDPTLALKVALYAALRKRDMTVADLADRLGMGDWHQAARLIDPKRATKLTTLMVALDALGCQVEIGINDDFVSKDAADLDVKEVRDRASGALSFIGSRRTDHHRHQKTRRPDRAHPPQISIGCHPA